MIAFRDFSYRYRSTSAPVLEAVQLSVASGDLAVVVGSTGAGKSTLLRALQSPAEGLGAGSVSGAVTVDGTDVRARSSHELAALVGGVGQDPRAGFVAETVEGEITRRLQLQSTGSLAVRRRVEEALDGMGIVALRHRALDTLSGGEQQRVALASVLALSPRVLVLDEPTSALDPAGAEEVLAALLRLVHDVGVTVLAAEHRLERVVEYADQLVLVEGGRCRSGSAADVLADSPIVPPVVELGRMCGWAPLPLSVRDARRQAGPLRTRLADVTPPVRDPVMSGGGGDGLVVRGLVVRYDGVTALRGVRMQARPGEVVALMGRNGSGKSSLLHAVAGSAARSSGSVTVSVAQPPQPLHGRAESAVTLVPQQAPELSSASNVSRACAAADHRAGAVAGTALAVYRRLCPGEDAAGTADPRRLSHGQRLALVIATRLASRPGVVLLDEPTRGLDYGAKTRLGALLGELADAGSVVVVATHDVEFVARTATRVVVLAEGEVVASGTTRNVLAASPVFAPQVAKVLAPQDWLTTDEVSTGLAEAARRGIA